MTDREPEPWETNTAGPFLTLQRPRGLVAVWAHGADRFTVRAPEGEQLVVGLETARKIAHALAREPNRSHGA